MNNELFVIKPNLQQFYGRTITKDMEFEEETDNKEVKQTLKDLVLTTEINKEWEFNGIKSTLHSTQTEELKEGTILLWSELDGYIIPAQEVYKIKDLEEEITLIKDIYKDNTDMNPS